MSSRGLSDSFLNDLKSGILEPILKMVQDNDTYDLEIRDNYINVYYRGASLLRLSEKISGKYSVSDFAEKYVILGWGDDTDGFEPTFKDFVKPLMIITEEKQAQNLVNDILPLIRDGIDRFLSKHPKAEREFQQLVVSENNYSPISNDTDYLICDIEYTHSDYRELRFDLLAAHWPSKSIDRQKPESMQLVLIEKKYGDGALTGSAGIKKHYTDLKTAHTHLNVIAEEMTTVVRQKAELCLIKKSKLDENEVSRISKIGINVAVKPVWILLIANHKPASNILLDELKWLNETSIKENFPYKIKIATANFMGYGLYDEAIYPLKEFLEIFSTQVFSR